MHLPSYSSLRHPIRVAFAILLTSLLSTGCAHEQAGETEPEDFPEFLQFARLGRGIQAHIDTTLRLISDPAVWTAYQDSLQPIIPFEAVDFLREMVLLAALPVPTGGYDLRIEYVEALNDTITVTYRLFMPGTDCRNADAPGVVFDVARLEYKEGVLRFVQEREFLKCTES